MGECGCGNFEADFQLPGPNGTVYAIQKAPGCPDCGTPHGIVIHRFSKAAAKEWGADELPVLDFPKLNGKDFDGQSRGLAVILPSALWKALQQHSTGDEFERTVDEEGLQEALASAAFEDK